MNTTNTINDAITNTAVFEHRNRILLIICIFNIIIFDIGSDEESDNTKILILVILIICVIASLINLLSLIIYYCFMV